MGFPGPSSKSRHATIPPPIHPRLKVRELMEHRSDIAIDFHLRRGPRRVTQAHAAQKKGAQPNRPRGMRAGKAFGSCCGGKVRITAVEGEPNVVPRGSRIAGKPSFVRWSSVGRESARHTGRETIPSTDKSHWPGTTASSPHSRPACRWRRPAGRASRRCRPWTPPSIRVRPPFQTAPHR